MVGLREAALLSACLQLAKQTGHKGFCYADTDFYKALQREVGGAWCTTAADIQVEAMCKCWCVCGSTL